jgi:hypothetical protein
MKILLIAVTTISTLLVGCDRQTLQGLNLKFRAELNSNYDNSEAKTQPQSESNSPVAENPVSSQDSATNRPSAETFPNQPVREIKAESDPDGPLPFKPLKDCSEAGITAQANKIFYASNPNLKSIDSKDEQQVKEWKAIYRQLEQKCQQ